MCSLTCFLGCHFNRRFIEFNFYVPSLHFGHKLQDYLGAFIVFCAILTALISSKIMPQNVQSSLVGLALNFTLLMPIYLNWVVKLGCDLEMYFGAVERIRFFIDCEAHREKVDYCKNILNILFTHY